MRAVVEETERTATACGIVNHLSHHRAVIFEEEFVADADLTGRLHQHVPQAQLFIEFAQQEHLDLGISLLLRTIETSREHLGVIEYKGVVLVEIVQDVTEVEIDGIAFLVFQVLAVLIFLGHLDTPALTVNNHQSALIAMISGFEGDQFLWQFEFKLR